MHQWPPSWQDLDSVVFVLSLFLSQDQNDQHAEKTKATVRRTPSKLRVSPCRSILPQPSTTRRKVNSFDSRCHCSSAVKIQARFHSNAIGSTNCAVQTGFYIKIAKICKMWVFWRSTTFRQAPTASINKALPGKKEKKSQTSSNYKPANVLRCVYDRIYVKLSYSVNKLYGCVLQCLHFFLH